jgi:YVTN family beta-propeller protein
MLGGAAVALGLTLALPGVAAAAKISTATTSSPIALSSGGKLVWTVNPDLDTVSVIRTQDNRVIRTIKVGNEPQSIALDPGNRYAYVANAADSNVTAIRINNKNPDQFRARIDRRVGHRGAMTTGAEPWNVVATPDGRRIFVANSAQDTITVIDATRRPRILGSIDIRNSRCNDPDRTRHYQPRGLAVTSDNKKLFVTSFLSFTDPGAKQSDDRAKHGVVCRFNINTRSKSMRGYRPAYRITLAPHLTGFNIDSDPSTLEPDPVWAFPNQLQSVVVRGDHAYLPNIAASPEGPRRRNGNTQSYVNEISGITDGPGEWDAGSANLHLAGLVPVGEPTLFYANPWAMAFTTQRGYGAAYVVLAGSDVLAKLWVGLDGQLAFTIDLNTTDFVDLNDPSNPATSGLKAGKNPQGIVINHHGNRAYVNNYVSRNVSVVDLTTDKVIKVIRTAPLPRPGTRDEVVELGKELFYTSRGIFNRPANATALTQNLGRMSSQGFGSCSGCHFKGLTDGVVWESKDGPRKTPPLNATFNPRHRSQQRMLNYSATFDEIEDFEDYVRGREGHGPGDLSSPLGQTIYKTCDSPPPDVNSLDPDHGLLMSDLGNPDRAPCQIPPFSRPNAGRPQWTVTMPGGTRTIPALEALKAYIQYGIRTPNAPLLSTKVKGGLKPSDVRAGRTLFAQSGCTSCHFGGDWTLSRKNFKSPPNPSAVFTETSPAPKSGSPVDIPYMNSFLRDIGSFNLGVKGKGNPLGHNIGAEELAGAELVGPVAQSRKDALGRDYNGDGKGNGYNVPSLLGIFAVPPYYHNGACETLDCVLHDVRHRTGNHKFRDRLKTSRNRARLQAFLESIDARTKPFSQR